MTSKGLTLILHARCAHTASYNYTVAWCHRARVLQVVFPDLPCVLRSRNVTTVLYTIMQWIDNNED